MIKGGRDNQHGHKLNLISGPSGLILDLVIEQGNPADTNRLLPMIERHIEHYEKAPRQVAADGGYASGANLEAVKSLGVSDMAFNKKRGLDTVDMAKRAWVYRQLRNFRAGIEPNISCLKRAYGLTRCNWKGLKHFESFVWSSVVSYNLTVMARLLPTKRPVITPLQLWANSLAQGYVTLQYVPCLYFQVKSIIFVPFVPNLARVSGVAK